MGELKFKEGVVLFEPMPPAGQAILDALAKVAGTLSFDLVVTSGADGTHSGPSDPHHSGNAYDVRSHDLINKQDILTAVMTELGQPSPSSGGYVTAKFFGWLEQADTDNEHFHFQLRRGQVYP